MAEARGTRTHRLHDIKKLVKDAESTCLFQSPSAIPAAVAGRSLPRYCLAIDGQ